MTVTTRNNYQRETGSKRHTSGDQVKLADRYLKYVRWEAEDSKYIGYCPDLFPWGGVCHGESEEETYRQLCKLVAKEVDDLQRQSKSLPEPATRPMRDALLDV